MLKFEQAFLCKSGKVGITFSYGKGRMCNVFHDGKEYKTSEHVPDVIQLKALARYFAIQKQFKKPS